MTLANSLTLTRAALAAVIFACIMIPAMETRIAALALFLVAAVTDWLDGRIARKTKSVTSFGIVADPFVDKVLVLAAFTAFAGIRWLGVPPWAVFLILARELTISTLRVLAAGQGKMLAAEKWGKFKTFFQLVAVFIILAILNAYTYANTHHGAGSSYISGFLPLAYHLTYYLSVATVVITWISGIIYLKNHRKLITNSWDAPKQ